MHIILFYSLCGISLQTSILIYLVNTLELIVYYIQSYIVREVPG